MGRGAAMNLQSLLTLGEFMVISYGSVKPDSGLGARHDIKDMTRSVYEPSAE